MEISHSSVTFSEYMNFKSFLVMFSLVICLFFSRVGFNLSSSFLNEAKALARQALMDFIIYGLIGQPAERPAISSLSLVASL